MRDSKTEWIAIAIVILTLICAFTAAHQRDELQQQAIDRGFAEWRIVSRYKKVEFKWKDEK